MKLGSIMDQLHVLKIQMRACKHNTFLVCKKLINGKFNYSEIFSYLFKFKM